MEDAEGGVYSPAKYMKSQYNRDADGRSSLCSVFPKAAFKVLRHCWPYSYVRCLCSLAFPGYLNIFFFTSPFATTDMSKFKDGKVLFGNQRLKVFNIKINYSPL